MNNLIIKNAKVGDQIKDIFVCGGVISNTAPTDCESVIDAKGKKVIPGLIDVHTHGCIGIDTMDRDLEPMCRYHAEHGTTSWLPTTITASIDDTVKVTEAKTDFEGANILGFHLEGPYINMKYKGAQNPAYIKNPDISEFRRFKNVKMITVAPEIEGGIDFIKEISKDTIVAIGHTDCTYEQAIEAIEAGANCLTHTYNAMPPIHHRNAGPIGAAVEKQIYAQLICDGFHISKPIVLATYKMFGKDRMVIISDSVRPAGLPDGVSESGGLTVYIKNKQIRLADGTIAGSYATLYDCVLKAHEFGIPFDEAVYMASATPANMLSIKKGHIKDGYDADLLILNDDLSIDKVIISGKLFK